MSAKDIAPYKGKRRKLLNYLLNPDNSEKTVAETCRDVGLATNTYYKYANEKKFNETLIAEAINAYARHLPQTATSVIKAAKGGDMRAVRLLHEALQLAGRVGNQSVNLGVSTEPQPTTLEIDTPEQREQALAQCYAERATLDELITNLEAMRQPSRLEGSGSTPSRGDGIHPDKDAPPHEEG